MSLHVVEPGWATRVVDLGRPGTRGLGVQVGGAADRVSLMLGNALVGNASDSAALEISGKGPRLRAGCDLACVLFGAPFDTTCGDQRVPPGRTFTLREDEELVIGGTASGMRAYLCVGGGIQVPVILGSRSGLEPLAANVDLPCESREIRRRFLPDSLYSVLNSTDPLRVLTGLQADWFHKAEFYGQEFAVTPASNRMGLRLEGRALAFPQREMVSEPVCPGAVQVTRDGQCIILGVDGQTIGGYPKIAQVIAADLDRLGQVRPGQRVQFRRVELAVAVELHRQREKELAEWLLRAIISLDGCSGGPRLNRGK